MLDKALEAVVNLTHRGAVSADAKTGDGAGVLTQIPTALFVAEATRFGVAVTNDDDLAVGVVFLPADDPGPAPVATPCSLRAAHLTHSRVARPAIDLEFTAGRTYDVT